MSVQWGQTPSHLSWHIFLTFTRMPGRARSLCGRNLDADTVRDERPGNAKTCENCLRIRVRQDERIEDAPDMGVTVSPV